MTQPKRVPLWHDPDDDEILIDMSEKVGKRRMRKDYDEKSISGTEYSKRLRAKLFIILLFKYRLAAENDVDSLFQLSSKVDANDDVATLLRTTKRFVGSSRTVPSDRLDIQKLSQFSLSEDNGEVAKNPRKVCFSDSTDD